MFFLSFDTFFIQLISLFKATFGYWFVTIYNKVWFFFNLNRPPRPGDCHLSEKWLTNILRTNKIIDQKTRVIECIIEDLQGNRGLCSSINVLKVNYDIDTNASTSFIIKTNNILSIYNRYTNASGKRYKEAFFYENFSGTLKQCVPKVYYTYVSIISGSYLILMENSKLNGVDVNFYFGNQIWGMKPLENPIDPVIMLRRIFLKAAEMHAKYWNDQSLLKIEWLRSTDWYGGKHKSSWLLGLKRSHEIWLRTKREKIFVKNTEMKWSSKLISIVDKSFENSTWLLFQKELKNPDRPFTLTHGDFHAANMINTHNSSLIWVDWSEVGIWEPMSDIGQIFISDVKPELRRLHEKQLIREYWEKLIECGVNPEEYTFDKCWRSYECSPIERWLWMFPLLCGLDIPTKALQYFHDQLLSFIEDHSDMSYYIIKPVSLNG